MELRKLAKADFNRLAGYCIALGGTTLSKAARDISKIQTQEFVAHLRGI